MNPPPGPGYPPWAGHPLPPVSPGIPPDGGGGGGVPHPVFPIWGPPGMVLPPNPGYPPWAGHPLPPIPPGTAPIEPPPPGTVVVPPGERPVQPIAIPEWILVYYPGIGYVLVGRPIMEGDEGSTDGAETTSSKKHKKD